MNPSETDAEELKIGVEELEKFQSRKLVGWESNDDPKKPLNWPLWKKLMTSILISMCTTSLYMGAAIVTSSQDEMQEKFHTSHVNVALGITLFIWGYGIGSLWFSPMSEIPLFRGRNPTYLVCQFIFSCLQIPTALCNNIASYAVLRFIAGIFAAPPLSTAGATLGDIWEMPGRINAIVLWAFGAIAGPYLGPLVGAAFDHKMGFRYVFWFMLAMSGGLFVLMLLLLPETSEQELLMRKARRLRKESGDASYIAPGELLMHSQTIKTVLKDIFFKPIKLTIMEPVVLLMNLHIGIVYAMLYLYLEAMPIVYMGVYGFNSVQMGVAFLAFLVGAFIGGFVFSVYTLLKFKAKSGPEKIFGPPAIFGAILFPIGILIWGWLSSKNFHWGCGLIGNVFFAISSFCLFQPYLSFMSAMFPPAAVGSAFASNNLIRSLIGGAFPLFGRAFYKHTAINGYPVGWGCSILAFIGVLMIPLPIYITLRGKSLREYAQRKYGSRLMR